MKKKKLVIIYSQGRSGTSILTRLVASNPKMYSGRAESPILYLLIATLALIKDVNNDKKYISRHSIGLIKTILYKWFLLTSKFYSIWESFKSRKLNQLPRYLNYSNSYIVTNIPVLPSSNWNILLLNELFDLRIISIVRNPLEVLASRISFEGFKYSIEEHIEDIVRRHDVWKTIKPAFIKYEDLYEIEKLKSFLFLHLGSCEFDYSLLDRKIHPTRKKIIHLDDLKNMKLSKKQIDDFEKTLSWYYKV